jgi:hypothetical protein
MHQSTDPESKLWPPCGCVALLPLLPFLWQRDPGIRLVPATIRAALSHFVCSRSAAMCLRTLAQVLGLMPSSLRLAALLPPASPPVTFADAWARSLWPALSKNTGLPLSPLGCGIVAKTLL